MRARSRIRNVIRIHDLGEVNGLKYLTMEYVQGADLGLLLKRQGKMAVGRALSVARQIADGLAAVHKAGIVHRDLKPANVIVDAEDHARLTDFGIARAVDAKTLYTLPGSWSARSSTWRPSRRAATPPISGATSMRSA